MPTINNAVRVASRLADDRRFPTPEQTHEIDYGQLTATLPKRWRTREHLVQFYRPSIDSLRRSLGVELPEEWYHNPADMQPPWPQNSLQIKCQARHDRNLIAHPRPRAP
jgi:hypothetical protein